MNTIIIINKVEITPDKLDSDINNHIIQELNDNMIGNCSQKYGYILEIKNIIKIENSHISNINGDIIFNVEYECVILKPEIDKIITCKVNMIFTHGIFAGIKELKILVPSNELTDYKFNSKDNTYYKNGKNYKKR